MSLVGCQSAGCNVNSHLSAHVRPAANPMRSSTSKTRQAHHLRLPPQPANIPAAHQYKREPLETNIAHIPPAVHPRPAFAPQAYTTRPRERWILEWPGQVVIAVGQVFWTSAVTAAMHEGGQRGLEQLAELNTAELMREVRAYVRACVFACVHGGRAWWCS